jgi:hypothetical protein
MLYAAHGFKVMLNHRFARYISSNNYTNLIKYAYINKCSFAETDLAMVALNNDKDTLEWLYRHGY